MSVIASYDDLAAAVKTYCARTDDVFNSQMSNFVSFAESRIYDGVGDPGDQLHSDPLRVREMYAEVELTPNAGGDYVIPADSLGLRTVNPVSNRISPDYLSPDAFKVREQRDNGGPTRWYTIEGSLIKIVPKTENNLELGYWQRPTELSSNNQQNGIIENYPNVYLGATMFEAMTWLQMDGAMGWLMRYRSIVSGANKTAESIRRGGGNLRSQPRRTIGAGLRW